jgi:hypothetical protein
MRNWLNSRRCVSAVVLRLRLEAAGLGVSVNLLLLEHPAAFLVRPYMGASSTGDARAMNILRELHAAVEELVGRAAVLTDGKAGTIDYVFLDDVHGLRISIAGHEGHWPISTVKLIEI